MQSYAGYYSITGFKNGTKLSNKMKGKPGVMVYPLPKDQYLLGGGFIDPANGGAAINLSSSEVGVNYQLYLNNTLLGSPRIGDGDSITFGNQTGIGKYTTIATNPLSNCLRPMPNYVIVAGVLDVTNASELDFRLLPNPSAGNFSIDFGSPNNRYNYVTIYNMTGAIVYSRALEPGISIVTFSTNIPTGEYIMRLWGTGIQSESVKLLIRR
jgi:hypothetical protein